MLSGENIYLSNLTTAYIAGIGDGIVTVNGKPVSRHIFLLDAVDFTYLRHELSLDNGHYIFRNLDLTKQYTIMCRDLPPTANEQRYEPAVFDYVTPATDLTIAEQQELWQSWQTSP